PRLDPRIGRIVQDEVGGTYLVDDGQVSLTPYLLDETAHQRLLLFCRHTTSCMHLYSPVHTVRTRAPCVPLHPRTRKWQQILCQIPYMRPRVVKRSPCYRGRKAMASNQILAARIRSAGDEVTTSSASPGGLGFVE